MPSFPQNFSFLPAVSLWFGSHRYLTVPRTPVCRVKYHYHKAASSHFGFTIPTSATIFVAPHLSSKIAGWIPHIDHMEHSFLTSLIWQADHGVSAFLLDRFLRPAGSGIQFSMFNNGGSWLSALELPFSLIISTYRLHNQDF